MIGIKNYLKKLIKYFNFSYSINVGGTSHKIPVIAGNRTVVVEKWMHSLLQRLIHSGTVIFDVGVNLGQTIIAIRSINEQVKIIGFEPNPACCFYLDTLLEQNRYKNITIFPVGLSEKSTVVKMDLYDEYITNSGGSIVDNYWDYSGIKPVKSVYVPVFRFKELDIENIPDIIKIDVEGAEFEVLSSLKSVISFNRPVIICEVLSAYDDSNIIRVKTQEKIENFLVEMGYENFVIRIRNNHELECLEKIDSFKENRFNKDDCNYLFMPRDAEITAVKDLIQDKSLN